jgi:hypothetical protein
MKKQTRGELLEFVRNHKLRDGYYTGQYYLKTDKEGEQKVVLQGLGIATYVDGRRFEGWFKKNKAVKGKVTWRNGDMYEGEFKGDRMNG